MRVSWRHAQARWRVLRPALRLADDHADARQLAELLVRLEPAYSLHQGTQQVKPELPAYDHASVASLVTALAPPSSFRSDELHAAALPRVKPVGTQQAVTWVLHSPGACAALVLWAWSLLSFFEMHPASFELLFSSSPWLSRVFSQPACYGPHVATAQLRHSPKEEATIKLRVKYVMKLL